MKYNIVPSGKAEDPDLQYIYIFPTSFEGSEYSVAYPECKAEDILAQKISIRTFSGCSPDAVTDIENRLQEVLKKKQLKYIEQLNTLFTAGIGVFVLGIINWAIPDPLPFIDELVFTIGGGFVAWKAWNNRKRKLPKLVEQIFRYGYEGRGLEVEADSFISLLYKSIRCKIDPLTAGEHIEGMDSIEIETLWLTRYLNNQENSDSEKYSIPNLKNLILVMERVFSVEKLSKLIVKKQTQKIRNRLKICKQDTMKKTGITDSALTVYIEFYKFYKNKL
ncbi:MAG: hypothetical protein DRP58_12735 [Spirochaetes bacterium]|nr:MAG: hypothetical protein DRP58_12735 [Spirochaetota bacterium]